MQTPVGSDSDPSTNPSYAEFWIKEIMAAKKDREEYTKNAVEAIDAFTDANGTSEEGTPVNMFWSNVQVMTGILYANPPKADVSRAHKDSGDDVARVAATMIERILNADIEMDDSTLESAWRKCVWDWIVPGMGQIWTRYDVKTEPVLDEMGQPIMLPEGNPAQRVANEDALTEYVNWDDFSWSPARTWDEVIWVARRVFMTKEAVTERFGEEVAGDLSYKKHKSATWNSNDEAYGDWKRAVVYEIWHKPSKTVVWIAEGYDRIIQRISDPLQLTAFFPCPEPLIMNGTTSRLIPSPLYKTAEQLYRQIDEISNRIKWLTRACKITGVYDQNAPGIKELFKRGAELQLIPVENWAALSERGGLKGAMEIVHTEQIAATIEKLRMEKAARVMELYEVLGLSDIMRGMANKVETATTQQLKSQYGSARMSVYGNQMERWISATLSLRAEIIIRHFSPETIMERSAIMATPDAQLAPQALQFLKDGRAVKWRIKVQSQSMSATDWGSEKAARTEFMKALGGMLQSAGPIIQQMPQSLPFFLEIMRWVMSGFRAGKEIETVLDSAIDSIRQQPPQPNPQQQAETQKTQAQAQEAQADAQLARSQAMMAQSPTNGMMPQ
jgi:hypothetical protein